MTSAKKIIAVIGATGNQGGAVVRAILNEGEQSEFSARAITRDITSQKAQTLKQLGAELAQIINITDVPSLTEAVRGCYGMYCVTILPDHGISPDKEKEQARCMAVAAKNAGIKHVIWSTLDDTRKLVPLDSRSIPTVLGKYKVPHFDAKAESDQYFAKLPTTYMLTSFYWDNFTKLFSPKKATNQDDGKKFTISLPMGKKRLAGIATEDIGKCALGIFKKPGDYIGSRVGIAGEALTLDEIAAKMSQVLGKEIAYSDVPFEAFRKFNADIANMFQYYHDCEAEFCAARDIGKTRNLNPDLMTFDQWLAKNKDRIPFP